MMLLRDENGEKVFKPKDHLTIDQVTSMFSRMASQKEKEQLKEPVKQNVHDDFKEAMKESDNEKNSTDNEVSNNEENIGVQNCLEDLKKLENLQVSDFVYVGLTTNKPGNFTTRNH